MCYRETPLRLLIKRFPELATVVFDKEGRHYRVVVVGRCSGSLEKDCIVIYCCNVFFSRKICTELRSPLQMFSFLGEGVP